MLFQGDPKFGISAGSQCTCCALVSVSFSLVKSPGKWIFSDLDFIVDKGDEVYRNVNKEGYLMFDELPKQITLFETNVNIDFLTNTYGVLYDCNLPGFLFKNAPSNADGLLLIIKGLCISVTWTKKHYFLFDSHSKNEFGKSCPNGSSLLLKFSSRKSLE